MRGTAICCARCVIPSTDSPNGEIKAAQKKSQNKAELVRFGGKKSRDRKTRLRSRFRPRRAPPSSAKSKVLILGEEGDLRPHGPNHPPACDSRRPTRFRTVRADPQRSSGARVNAGAVLGNMITSVPSKLVDDIPLQSVGKQSEAGRERKESEARDNRASRASAG